ncbi:hypothetical protein GCM10010149_47750 [Nonomuraea roseoviolacea subsp. roseoviolacea]
MPLNHREIPGGRAVPIRVVELRFCDYCAAEKEGQEVEATDEIVINGRRALACDKHGKPVRKMLDAFEAVSEPVTVAPPSPGRGRRAGARQTSHDGQAEPAAKDVRAWALAENEKAGKQLYVVAGNSKLRTSVINAYKAAHGLS